MVSALGIDIQTFTPVAMMGVDPRHRQGPDHVANRRIIEILWPDAVREPFNQPEKSLGERSIELCLKMRQHGVRGTISKGMEKLQTQVAQRSNG